MTCSGEAGYHDFSALPSELWLAIFKKFHPLYDDLFVLTLVCKKWRNLISTNPDPSLWENLNITNFRNCSYDTAVLFRFKNVLKKFGRLVKYIRLQKCHELFSDVLDAYAGTLSSLHTLEISGMVWAKRILKELICHKSLKSILLESAFVKEGIFAVSDLRHLVESFPNMKTLSLHYSVVTPDTVAVIKDLSCSRYGRHITCLLLERARIEASDIKEVVRKLQGLMRFSYGNDQIHGLPSVRALHLNSSSLVEVDLFQIGDFAQFHFVLPNLKKLTLSGCTSVNVLNVEASTLRILHLLLCVEIRTLRKVSASSLRELKLRRCNALHPGEFIGVLVRNPDIKSLELEVYWASLRLDQHSSPSLEKLTVFDSGEHLTSVDIRCPKLQQLHIKKAMTRPTILKVVSVSCEDVKNIVLHDVPYLRKVNIEVSTISHLEVNFDRRPDHVKPAQFTKFNFRASSARIGCLTLKRCNLQSLTLSRCNVSHVTLEYCNLDCPVNDAIQHCGSVEVLTIKKCYGPCQLNLNSIHLREVYIVSCTALLMDHINLSCPSLEVFSVSGLTFLPTPAELDLIASSVRKLSPLLGSVKFSY